MREFKKYINYICKNFIAKLKYKVIISCQQTRAIYLINKFALCVKNKKSNNKRQIRTRQKHLISIAYKINKCEKF